MSFKISVGYGVTCLITICAGLLSRTSIFEFPQFVHLYVGDYLWAMMVYWGISALRPDLRVVHRGVIAVLIAFTIEFSQLYQAPLINEVRHTTLGGLVLGFGFKLSDLVAYTLGICTAGLIDKHLRPILLRNSKR